MNGIWISSNFPRDRLAVTYGFESISRWPVGSSYIGLGRL